MDESGAKQFGRLDVAEFRAKLDAGIEAQRIDALRDFFAPHPEIGLPGRGLDEEFSGTDYTQVLLILDASRQAILSHETRRENGTKLATEYARRGVDDIIGLEKSNFIASVGEDKFVLTKDGKGILSPRQ